MAPAACRAWLVLRRGDPVMQFDGPVLELMTAADALDQRIAALGPDVVSPRVRRRRFLRRLREDDPTRPIGDTLLDQRVVAGHRDHLALRGVMARGVDP